MSGIYICEKCGWEGDYPFTAHPEYEDGGWYCCPNGCVSNDGEPEGVVENFAHPEVQRRFARAMKAGYKQ